MLAALMLWLPAEAQLHRGGRTIVRGGMFVKPDSLRHKSDSLANNALTRELDSLLTLDFTADSLAVTALRTDDIRTTDSLMRLRLAGIKTEPDSMRHKKGWLMSDSMSLCPYSTVRWERGWRSTSTKTGHTSRSSGSMTPTPTRTSRVRPNWTHCRPR